MATKLYDLIVATSKYQDQNGQEKRKWENVGAVFQDKDQQGNSYSYIMLKRHFNPAGIECREGADAIRITLSKPKQQQGQQQQQGQGQYQSQQQPQNNSPFGNTFDGPNGAQIEDIPF